LGEASNDRNNIRTTGYQPLRYLLYLGNCMHAANTMNLISETLHNHYIILIDIAFADYAAMDTQLAMNTGSTIVELEKRLSDALEQ